MTCKRCAVPLQPGAGNFIRITIDAVADPSQPILADASPAELRRQIEQLLAQVAGLSEQQALDQVYRRLIFYLCGPCYQLWIANPVR
jgi:hypothetical protein